MRLVPGRVTCRHLRRSSPYHEKTLARWLERDVDFVSRNHAALVTVVRPPTSTSAPLTPVLCPTVVSGPLVSTCSGTAPTAVRKRACDGPLAWVEVTQNRADPLRVAQTPPTLTRDAEPTRSDPYPWPR